MTSQRDWRPRTGTFYGLSPCTCGKLHASPGGMSRGGARDGPGPSGCLSSFYDRALAEGVGSVLQHGAPARVAVASFPPMARS